LIYLFGIIFDLQLLIYLFVLSVVLWFTAVDLPLCIICRSLIYREVNQQL
jgi:hypothetical protein